VQAQGGKTYGQSSGRNRQENVFKFAPCDGRLTLKLSAYGPNAAEHFGIDGDRMHDVRVAFRAGQMRLRDDT
jgi:hypothetical protein